MKTFKQILNELSKKKLAGYTVKAVGNVAKNFLNVSTAKDFDRNSNLDQTAKRMNGIKKAVSKIKNEEVEQVEESRKDEGDKNANSYRSDYMHSAVKDKKKPLPPLKGKLKHDLPPGRWRPEKDFDYIPPTKKKLTK